MEDSKAMAIDHLLAVIRDALLNDLERSSIPLSDNLRKWCDEVPVGIISGLAEAGWSFTLDA